MLVHVGLRSILVLLEKAYMGEDGVQLNSYTKRTLPLTISTNAYGYLKMPSSANIKVHRGAQGNENAYKFFWYTLHDATYYKAYHSKNNKNVTVYDNNKSNFLLSESYLVLPSFIILE